MKKILLFVCALICSAAMSATDVYLVPNSNWLGGNARFAVYCFQGETNQWVDMEAVDGAENTFKATVDETKFQNLIFCRMNPATTENNWDNKWSQSVDLTVPTDNKVVYHVKDATWDKGGGEWTALGEDPGPIETVYVVTGSSAVIFGTTWNNSSACVLAKQADGSYVWTKEDVELTASTIEYKYLEKGTWDGWQLPAKGSEPGNASFTIDKSGKYDLTFTLSADLSTQNVQVTLKEEVEVKSLIKCLHGNFTGTWNDTEAFTYNAEKTEATLTLALEADKDCEFGMRFTDADWKANGATLTAENNSTNITEGSGNMHIVTTVAGNYVFKYVNETNILSVTYPQATSFESATSESTATKVIRNGQVLIIRDGVAYDMMGQEIK